MFAGGAGGRSVASSPPGPPVLPAVTGRGLDQVKIKLKSSKNQAGRTNQAKIKGKSSKNQANPEISLNLTKLQEIAKNLN